MFHIPIIFFIFTTLKPILLNGTKYKNKIFTKKNKLFFTTNNKEKFAFYKLNYIKYILLSLYVIFEFN